MRITFRTSLAFPIAILFTFLSLQSFAQPRGMTMNQVYSQVNKEWINQRLQQMQMDMMNMLHTGIATQQEFDFIVTMHDSTTKQVNSALFTDSVTKKHFIVWVDKSFKKSDTNRYKKIFPSQTQSLTCVLAAKTDDDPGHYVPGIITDSCWMFRTLTGPINVYTFDACSPTGGFDDGAIVGIQLKDGPIVAYTEENLKAMVNDDLEALQLILEKKYVRAIKKFNRDIQKHKPVDKPETAN
ncbi:MAG: hypothetical protein JSU01_01940 [Bacteroidetes bacterium]|nr:hypothetical protein [Bacteroidota bacterium]